MEEKEIEKEVEKKKSQIGKIILVIILMLACLWGGYYLSAKDIITIGKDKAEEAAPAKNVVSDENEAKVTVYSTTDPKVSKLIETLISGLGCANLEEFTNDKKVEAKDVSNERAFTMAQWEFYNANKDEVSVEEYTKEVHKLLGSDYNFNPEGEIKNACPSYEYDKTKKKFVKTPGGCGGTCGPHTIYQIVKAVDTDGVLDMEVKVLFFKEGVEGYFADYERTKQLNQTFETIVPLGFPFADATSYKFTFKDVDGYYAFVSSEPVK